MLSLERSWEAALAADRAQPLCRVVRTACAPLQFLNDHWRAQMRRKLVRHTVWTFGALGLNVKTPNAAAVRREAEEDRRRKESMHPDEGNTQGK